MSAKGNEEHQIYVENNPIILQVSKVQVAVRAAVVSSLFRKALRTRIRGAAKSSDDDGEISEDEMKDQKAAQLSSSGSVMNLMSTDCDRISNFCPSFHQFWSLPFQIAVALYLLYRQVGMLSFFFGLLYASDI